MDWPSANVTALEPMGTTRIEVQAASEVHTASSSALLYGREQCIVCFRLSGDRGQIMRPNVRVKPAPTVWRAGQHAHNGPQAQRMMAGATSRWGSA